MHVTVPFALVHVALGDQGTVPNLFGMTVSRPSRECRFALHQPRPLSQTPSQVKKHTGTRAGGGGAAKTGVPPVMSLEVV
jgi:hypothetical protein